MALQDFQQRIVDEKTELDKKLKALKVFIDSNVIFAKLPAEERELLVGQRIVM